MTETVKHKILLDKQPFTTKPKGGSVAGISRRLPGCATEASIQEIALAVGKNGQTFIPAYLEGGTQNEHWKSQSLFALDFDCGIDFFEVRERAHDLALGITFAYWTFSSRPEHPKFRVVWQLDTPYHAFSGASPYY